MLNLLNIVQKIKKYLRIVLFIFFSVFLRWPVWLLLFLLKPFHLFGFIFVVYPGSDRDLEPYCPKKIAKSWLFSGKPVIGGFVTKGQSKSRGLVLVIPDTIQELRGDLKRCQKIIKRIKLIKYLSGAKTIALAGQLPGVFVKNGIELDYPFVKGALGTVFCVLDTVELAIKNLKITKQKINIAQIGVGFVGGLLLDSLKGSGYQATGIDIVVKEGETVLASNSREILEKADVIIVLTPRGSDFNPYAKWIKKGAVVIDDTHPKIEVKPDNVLFYKVAVGLPGVKFVPALSGYKKDWIPGCAVEGCIASIYGDSSKLNISQFYELAKKEGFFAHAIN